MKMLGVLCWKSSGCGAMAQSRAKPNAAMPSPVVPEAKAQAAATMPAPTIQTSAWWNRAKFIGGVTKFVGILAAWVAKPWGPAAVSSCYNLVHEWRHIAGLWPALEIMAAECFLSDSIPLVAATLQYGRTLPEKYEHYESNTEQHETMRQTTDLAGVHAFYAEAGMGKSTVAAAVLQDLQHQAVPVPAAFVTFETPGELKLQVATTLQSTTSQLSRDLIGAMERLNRSGINATVLVIDALDEHLMTDSDVETVKLLAGVSWNLLQRRFEFSVICLVGLLDTKRRFEQMNGGHKITGGLAAEACPRVPSGTLQSYANRLHVANDYKRWTDAAPYLMVVKRFADGKYNMSRVVDQYKEICQQGYSFSLV